ncbi:MAG: hypothetical protein P4L28_01610 [Paludibacteraceae bacterium]|nr:hypothetical protein [Paludibacteraceae bacterium]
MSEVILKSSSIVLEKHKLVIDIFEGVVNLPIFKAHKLKQAADKLFSPDYSLLSDFNRITVDMLLEELPEYANFVIAQGNIVGKRKSAVVTSNPHQMIYAQVYDKSVRDITSQTIQIFTSFNPAIEFLDMKDFKDEILDAINYYRENPRFYWSADGTLLVEKF